MCYFTKLLARGAQIVKGAADKADAIMVPPGEAPCGNPQENPHDCLPPPTPDGAQHEEREDGSERVEDDEREDGAIGVLEHLVGLHQHGREGVAEAVGPEADDVKGQQQDQEHRPRKGGKPVWLCGDGELIDAECLLACAQLAGIVDDLVT